MFVELTHGLLIGFGALLSGIAALITALHGLRKVKQEAADDCDKRIDQMNDAFRMGMTVELRDEGDERWSHLP